MKKLQIFFALFSLGCGGSFWWWIIPYLQRKNDFLFKVLISPYSFFNKFLPYPDYTYFILLSFLVAFLILILCEIIYFSTKEKQLTTRGSAHWATRAEVKDLLKSKGVPIGRFDGKIIRTDQTHIVTCAGTRSGKGIGGIIPALLEYPESIVCLDIKGENFTVTGERRKDFGCVFVLNPFGLLDIPTNSFNWLDTINLDNEDCITKANNLASAIVGRDPGNNVENHFNEQAIRLLQGVILLVCDEKLESRNMATVSELIHRVPINELCELMASKTELAYGVVSSVGSQFLNNVNEKELGSILSTAQRATNFLDNPGIKRTITKSDFKLSMLPDQIMSIYLIIPQDQVKDFRTYIRVFFDFAISSLTSRKSRGKYQVLFLLDELAQIGFLEIIPKAIALLKGMGGQLWLFFQSYAQMQNIYGKDADTILGNSTQIFYGCNDNKTAKLISDNLGKKTIREYKKNGEYNDIPKDLLSPDEIRKLSPENPIILMAGHSPIMVKRLDYRKNKEYRGLFDENPYFN